MKKKAIITTALILAVALIGGLCWYSSQPAPVEEPAEPEGGEIAVNSEPQQDTPEPEADSEPEKDTPENTPENEGDGDGELVWNEETGEFEPAYGVGNTEESTTNPDLANMTEEELKQYLEDAKKEFEDGIQQSIEDVKNGNFGSDTQDTQDQQQQQQQQQQGQQGQGQQQQGQGGGQQQGQMTVDEVLKKLQEAGINTGYGTTDGGTGDGGGLRPDIHW